ncbi:MAG: GIY-YIG nuclease family protein [Candidatus Doudnabacteria bacterium]|nr:GIY-YIG nuclease family protein [Candidatus Doudnabacteria bacterium]
MYIVYVLKDKNGKYYKGLTNNLSRRLREHIGKHTTTTSKMVDIKVVYTEQFPHSRMQGYAKNILRQRLGVDF